MSLTFMPSLYISDCLCTYRYNALKENNGSLCDHDRYIEGQLRLKLK